MNRGIIIEKQANVKDWRFGGVTGISSDVLNPDGDWTEFLPNLETQRSPSFDTMSCVSFSALNCVETYMKAMSMSIDARKWLKDNGYISQHEDTLGDYNCCDRWLAVDSGTTKEGNSMSKVAEAMRKGLVAEQDFPWDKKEIRKWGDYMSVSPLKRKELEKKASEFNERFKISWQWVIPELSHLKKALKYGPVQVIGYAWPKPVNGIYPMSHNKPNHAFMIYKVDEDMGHYEIYDHYEKDKKKLALDYKFVAAMQFHVEQINSNNMPKLSIPDNTLVQQVGPGGSGEFGMILDDKIMVGDTALLLATFHMCNNGDTVGKTLPLTKEVWDTFQKIDTSRNLVS